MHDQTSEKTNHLVLREVKRKTDKKEIKNKDLFNVILPRLYFLESGLSQLQLKLI